MKLLALALRSLTVVVAMVAAPLFAEAQQAGGMYRVGVLSPGSAPPGPLEAFRDGLRDFGYLEGKTVVIDWRFAGGRNDVLPQLARDLAQANVDVIVAVNTGAAHAAKDATRTIPIVFVRGADPVKSGLVASFARPGGNVTGITSLADELAAKQMQLLKTVIPGITRVAVLWNAGNPGLRLLLKEMDIASSGLGLQLHSLPVQKPEDLQVAIEAAVGERVGALFVMDDLFITPHKALVLKLATNVRLPVFSYYREFVEAGGVMAYGASTAGMYRRAAYFVDKILKGAKPGDLPIEQPTKFELFINLKSAKTLGLAIPPAVLSWADEVIQ